MASTYLSRTESAGSRTTCTWSAWVKRSKSGSSQFLASCSYSASDEAYFFFNGGDKLIWQYHLQVMVMYKQIDYLEIQMLGII